MQDRLTETKWLVIGMSSSKEDKCRTKEVRASGSVEYGIRVLSGPSTTAQKRVKEEGKRIQRRQLTIWSWDVEGAGHVESLLELRYVGEKFVFEIL